MVSKFATKKVVELVLFIATTFVITACASVSDVVSTGDGAHMVASHGVDGNGSGAAQKVIALQAANNYCNTRSEQMQLIHAEQTEPFFGRAPSAQVDFRCIKP